MSGSMSGGGNGDPPWVTGTRFGRNAKTSVAAQPDPQTRTAWCGVPAALVRAIPPPGEERGGRRTLDYPPVGNALQPAVLENRWGRGDGQSCRVDPRTAPRPTTNLRTSGSVARRSFGHVRAKRDELIVRAGVEADPSHARYLD
jgi:hypothetical protein